MNRRRFLQIAALAGLGGAVLARAERSGGGQWQRWEGVALGTTVSIELWAPEAALARVALAECRRELVRLEAIFSLYDGLSALRRLNREGFLEQPPAELVEVLALGARAAVLTGGAFDLSVHPLCARLAQPGEGPGPAEWAALRQRVDYRAIRGGPERVRLERPGMALTCNAVAQGYITDRIAELLQARGFSHTLLDLGERRALGGHPQGRAWRLGVAQPGRPGEIAGVVELEGRALATSGAYGQRFAGGRHHLLEAQRGECREDFASVTVVAPSAAVADVLSTCLAVVPPAEAGPVLRGLGPAEVWVVRAGEAGLQRWEPPGGSGNS